MKVVLLAFRPAPRQLSAWLPLNLAGIVAVRKTLALAGVVTDAVMGAVLYSVKLTELPVSVLLVLSVPVGCTLYLPSPFSHPVGRVALLVQAAAVLLVVALW